LIQKTWRQPGIAYQDATLVNTGLLEVIFEQVNKMKRVLSAFEKKTIP
jgi:hypothetical protein